MMFPLKQKSNPQRGMALVVALAMIVLLSVVVLALLARVSSNQGVETSRVNRVLAEQLALTASDYVRSQFLNEIVDPTNSTVNEFGDPVGTFSVYTPLNAASMMPRRQISANITAANANFTNLIRQSVPGADSAASTDSTATAARNRRTVGPSRWNETRLVGGSGFAANQVPSWVYVRSDGSASATAGNDTIGRFAYNVFDVGGLLDVTVAGYTSGAASGAIKIPPAEQVARKGSLAYADLTRIGMTVPEIDQLVAWRNAATGATGTSFADYIAQVAPLSGYMETAPGDRKHLGRQDLIRFWSAQINASSDAPLRFLTTFARDQNRPTWRPLANPAQLTGFDPIPAPVAVAYAPLVTNFNYLTNADETSAFNRNLLNVRVINEFTRNDGSTAPEGESLIQKRFDLNRLAWITHANTMPTGVDAALIRKYFGLVRNADGSWTYDHGDPKKIRTLAEVAAANREPDFFELLQAGILRGSLGLFSGDEANINAVHGGELWRQTGVNWETTTVRTEVVDSRLVHQMEKYQVIQIGANMIDQFDGDSFPTEILLNGETFSGIENLPYVNSLAQTVLRPPPGGGISPNNFQAYVHQWMTCSLWNPHQNASIASSGSPTQFRLLVRRGVVRPWVAALHANPGILGRNGPTNLQGRDFETNPSWIQFQLSDYPSAFAEPTRLDYGRTTVSEPLNKVDQTMGGVPWKRVGIYLGWSFSPDTVQKVPLGAPLPLPPRAAPLPPIPPSTEPRQTYRAAVAQTVLPMNVELQYQDPTSTNWRTYQMFYSLHLFRDGRGDPYMAPGDPAWATVSLLSFDFKGPTPDSREAWTLGPLDPRIARLNLSNNNNNPSQGNFIGTWNPRSFPRGPHFQITPSNWLHYVNNHTTVPLPPPEINYTYYTDRDFVRRTADQAGGDARDAPLAAGAMSKRPIMLNRPFRNVAELGYVSRDLPWKSLDFFSATSADGALLDLFTVGGGGAGPLATLETVPAVTAGKVNLNSAPVEVIESLVSGALRDYSLTNPNNVNTTVTQAEATALAAALAAGFRNPGPMQSLGEIPARMPGITVLDAAATSGIKARREAAVRALAESAQVNTWNLMVDLVAQSGRMIQGQFMVEGEKQVWEHVAMDRFTGKIVDELREDVMK